MLAVVEELQQCKHWSSSFGVQGLNGLIKSFPPTRPITEQQISHFLIGPSFIWKYLRHKEIRAAQISCLTWLLRAPIWARTFFSVSMMVLTISVKCLECVLFCEFFKECLTLSDARGWAREDKKKKKTRHKNAMPTMCSCHTHTQIKRRLSEAVTHTKPCLYMHSADAFIWTSPAFYFTAISQQLFQPGIHAWSIPDLR